MTRTSILNGAIANGIFQQQPQLLFNQSNPVSGTPYVALAATDNVRITNIAIYCEWTVQPSPIELRIVIDGITFNFSAADPASATWFEPLLRCSASSTNQSLIGIGAGSDVRSFFMEGKSVQILGEITGGTVQTLIVQAFYSKRL